MLRHSAIPPNICFTNKIFYIVTVLQNIEVLAAEETSGFTYILTLDSAIGHYLAILAKIEIVGEKNNQISYCAGELVVINVLGGKKGDREERGVYLIPFEKNLTFKLH